jgi:hypothetical protein
VGRRWIAAGVVIACLGAAAPAGAEGDPAAAEALFREGRAALSRGEHARACEKFRESYRLEAAQGTALNLADCEEKLGQLASAWQRFRGVAEELPAGDDRKTIAEQRARALEPRVPRLSISLANGAPAETRVTRDGVELGQASLGASLPVNPGEHVVVVSAPGHAEKRIVLRIAEGRSESAAVAPGEPIPTAPAQPSRTENAEPDRGKRTVGIVLGSAGLLAVGFGAYFGVRALTIKGDTDRACPGDKCAIAADVGRYDDARTSARIADVCFGVGIVAIGVGAYLFVSAQPARRAAVRLTPTGLGGAF